MTQYIIKTLPKYAQRGYKRSAAMRPYLGEFEWFNDQLSARRFASAEDARDHLRDFYPRYYCDIYGARVVRLKPRKK